MSYSVSTMAKLLNLAPSTLRYYDKIGLLPFVKRSGGGMRILTTGIMNGCKLSNA